MHRMFNENPSMKSSPYKKYMIITKQKNTHELTCLCVPGRARAIAHISQNSMQNCQQSVSSIYV